MSTNDVPGFDPAHRDELAMGCWAEHEDGSLLLVQSTEGGRVVYMMFDVTDGVTEYRDAMPEKQFKDTFSWNSKSKKKVDVKWTWHDKTPFPFDRIIKAGAKDGVHFASAEDQLSAAAKVAKSLQLRKAEFRASSVEHLMEKIKKGPTASRVIRAVQAAISELRS